MKIQKNNNNKQLSPIQKISLQARNQAVMYDGICSIFCFVTSLKGFFQMTQSSLRSEMGSLTWLSGHKEQYCSKVRGQFQLIQIP